MQTITNEQLFEKLSTLPAPCGLFGKCSCSMPPKYGEGDLGGAYVTTRARILSFQQRQLELDVLTVRRFLGFQVPLTSSARPSAPYLTRRARSE